MAGIRNPLTSRLGPVLLFALSLAFASPTHAQFSLIPMDDAQSDHLRAYGVAYWALDSPRNWVVEWVLNYRGGSFLVYNSEEIQRKCIVEGVTVEPLTHEGRDAILRQIESTNTELVTLEKAPKVAVYAPPNHEPWDDAVTLVLEYSKIPYDTIWDPNVLDGELSKYDWVHLHHEDFTAQYGKFFRSFRTAPWYREKVRLYEQSAAEAGFETVAEHKRAVVVLIADYVTRGGFLFAMCSACDTLDIALAAEGIDIIEPEIDGNPMTPGAQEKLRFDNCIMFENFTLYPDPMRYEFSNIDCGPTDGFPPIYQNPRFDLIEFSAKHDPVPSMLTQCHADEIGEFRGQTSAFRKDLLKKDVRIMAEFVGEGAAKYIHRNFGEGTVTYYGGHDPEDYEHIVGEPPTDLSLHKNSPGYRLILNNILFPAAKKKERET